MPSNLVMARTPHRALRKKPIECSGCGRFGSEAVLGRGPLCANSGHLPAAIEPSVRTRALGPAHAGVVALPAIDHHAGCPLCWAAAPGVLAIAAATAPVAKRFRLNRSI